MMNVKINNAIISCYDKTNLEEFANQLVKTNPEIKIYSSSGTFKLLQQTTKNNLIEISEYTGFKEMPTGLVKTLHPKIHSGILADLNNPAQKKYLQENNIQTFDLVAVNLYPFEKTVEEKKSFEETRQTIDIGGVSLLESASKNFLRVATISDPNDYSKFINLLNKNNASSNPETRLNLAKKAFQHLNQYINAINKYFSKLSPKEIR